MLSKQGTKITYNNIQCFFYLLLIYSWVKLFQTKVHQTVNVKMQTTPPMYMYWNMGTIFLLSRESSPASFEGF